MLFRSSTVLFLAVALSKPLGALASYQEDVESAWRQCYDSNNCDTTCDQYDFSKGADETCDEFKDDSCAGLNACCNGCAAEFNSFLTCGHVQWVYEFVTKGKWESIPCQPFVCGDEPEPGPTCADEAIAIRACFDKLTCRPSDSPDGFCHDYNLCYTRDKDTCCSQCASEINAYLDCQKPNHCAYCPGDPTPPPTAMPIGTPSAAPSFSLPPSAGPTSAPSGAPTDSPTNNSAPSEPLPSDEEDNAPDEPLPVTVVLFVPRLILGAFLGLLSFFGSLFGLA